MPEVDLGPIGNVTLRGLKRIDQDSLRKWKVKLKLPKEGLAWHRVLALFSLWKRKDGFKQHGVILAWRLPSGRAALRLRPMGPEKHRVSALFRCPGTTGIEYGRNLGSAWTNVSDFYSYLVRIRKNTADSSISVDGRVILPAAQAKNFGVIPASSFYLIPHIPSLRKPGSTF